MPLTPFGDLLHRLRKNAKLSQRDLATRVGLDVTTLSKLENGHMEPPPAETIQRISTAINANADDARELLRVAREVLARLQRERQRSLGPSHPEHRAVIQSVHYASSGVLLLTDES
jgi:transcriptional regulator with XRE-family HTH domain